MNTFPYSYLRLSLTDRCSFDCFYCRPSERQAVLPQEEILSRDEILSLANLFSRYGVKHVRLTGGEPLLRQDFAQIVARLSEVPGLERLSVTTNGFLLADFLPVLTEYRVYGINVSLDTLKKDRFAQWTGIDGFASVCAAALGAKSAGIKEVKLNVVLLRGLNDDEILDFVSFSQEHNIDVRFIEYFPTRSRVDAFSDRFIPSSDVFRVLERSFGALVPLGQDALAGPARYFRVPGLRVRIGFISSVTDYFCGACNRLRVTSDGKLFACLRSDRSADLRKELRGGTEASLRAMIEEILQEKRAHTKATCSRVFEMASIGG